MTDEESIADRNKLEDELARMREDRKDRMRENIATITAEEMSND